MGFRVRKGGEQRDGRKGREVATYLDCDVSDDLLNLWRNRVSSRNTIIDCVKVKGEGW